MHKNIEKTKEVYYVWDESLILQCDRLPAVLNRASMVHSLIVSYNLLNKIKVVRSSPATYTDLKDFHAELYIDHLKGFEEVDEDYMSNDQDEEYGIGYDCPPVSQMYELVSTIAGGSVTAAKCLVLGVADIVINWCGGWHHAQRFGAEGFCYVNDIVLAIEKLRRKFKKVLYIDLDVHHGNGVQDAYNLSKSVFTLSFHKFEAGFYPGTGSVEDVGDLEGKGYTCNVPFHALYSDETLKYTFQKVFTTVCSQFAPDAIVVQCGADALARDPNGGGQLTIRGYCDCLRAVLDKRKPTMLLGGGGYSHANTARLWTSLTALAAGVTLDDNIPEHRFWTQYGPDYTLNIEPMLAKDTNKQDYLDSCISVIQSNLAKYLQINDEPQNKKAKPTSELNRSVSSSDNTSKKIETSIEKANREVKYRLKQSNTEPVKSVDVYTFTE